MPRSPHVAKLIRFPPEVWERLEVALRRERRSITAQVVWLVERWLDEQERQERVREPFGRERGEGDPGAGSGPTR